MRPLTLWTCVLILPLLLTADGRTSYAQPQPAKGRNPLQGAPAGAGGPRGRMLPEGVTVERDLSYVGDNDRKHKLDLYLPEKSDKLLPLIISIHGGGWAMGDKAGGSPILPLTQEGYAMAVISYRLSEQAKFPAQIQDCQAAVRWLRANAAKYGLDPDRFGTWGGSAGGHLSALTGASGGSQEFEPIGGNFDVSDRVQAVCDLFGPTDFLKMNEQSNGRGPIQHDGARSPESQLIGGPIQENKEKAARANPINYITQDCPPFLIMHGLRDDLVPIGQSEILLEALQQRGVEATLIKLRAGHGGPEFSGPENLQIIQEFFDKHLKNAGSKKGGITRETKVSSKAEQPVQAATPSSLGKQDRPLQPPAASGRRPPLWGTPVRVGGGMNVKEFEYKQTEPQPLHLWVFYPAGWKASDSRAGMVFFCGGAWSHADHNEFVPWANYLASRGMVAAVAEYRPKGAFTCDEDATSAIRWFRMHNTELGVDPQRIGAGGGSAGGQMAAYAAMCEPRNAPNEDVKVSGKPNVLVLFDAVLDMKNERAASRLSAAEQLSVSPIDHLAKDNVPTLLFYGTRCPFVGQGREFLAKSQTLGNKVQLYTAPDGGHTYYFQPPWRQLTFMHMDDFLVSLGYLNDTAAGNIAADVKHTNENISSGAR